jgi:hypothetical protein
MTSAGTLCHQNTALFTDFLEFQKLSRRGYSTFNKPYIIRPLKVFPLGHYKITNIYCPNDVQQNRLQVKNTKLATGT